MDRTELVKKHNGELVGGRVSVFHDGRRRYITDVGDDGNWQINKLGKELEEAAKPVEEVKGIKKA